MSEKEPLVSVGIPTFNRPEALRNALEGIVGQTYKNLEIIVSDNGTPGNLTETVVQEFMREDSRISYFRQAENRGVFFNFQFVLDKATGEYFMWAADDDYRAPTFVATLVDLMRRNPECAISFCNFVEVTVTGGEAEGYPRHLALLQPFTSPHACIRLVRFYLQLEVYGKANLAYGLIRRSLLRDFNWVTFVDKHGEYGIDMLLIFALLLYGKLALSEESLYQCVVGNKKDTITSAPIPRSFGEKLAIPFIGLAKQQRYSWQYLLIAKGPVRFVLALFWPLKALDIFVRIFLVTEIKNAYNRVVRRLTRIELR